MREDNRNRWAATGRGKRKGKRLSKRQRDAVLRKWPQCHLRIPGRCLGKSTEADHLIDVEDGGTNHPSNLRGACHPCHEYKSARNSQRRSVAKQNEWRRKPEPHPGVLRDDEL